MLFETLLLAFFIWFLFRKIRPKRVVSSDGKAVLITGCDSGFGNRLAQKLNGIGFRVYATVLNTDSPGAHELKTNAIFAEKMIVLQMNVTNDNEVNKVLEKVKKDLESSDHMLWAVVNNAGILTSGLLEWGTLDNFRQSFEVNVFGTVRVTRAFLPLIKATKGRIVNICSFSGRNSFKRVGIYSMTKHSLVAFTDTLRRELYNLGVKVISVEPGYFKTQISSMDNFVAHLSAAWDQSSDEVKRFYGSPEQEIKSSLALSNTLPAEDNLDVAVDDIIDAIINCRPKLIYSPMKLSMRLISIVLFYSPPALIDWISNYSENLVRDK